MPAPRVFADASLASLLLAAGCADRTFHARGELSETVNTVVEVSWEPLGGGEAWVEFGPDEDYGRITPAVVDGSRRSQTLLLGNKPFQQVHWRVVAADGDDLVVGPGHVTETLGLPAPLPDVRLMSSDGSFDGYVLGVSWAIEVYLYILDADGDFVWYHELDQARVSLSVAQVPDQPALRFMQVNQDHELDDSVAITLGMDGQQLDSVPMEQAHHSFLAHQDGSLVWLAIDVDEHEDYGDMVGDRLLRRDAATGQVSELWSSWDQLEYDPSLTLEADFYSQGIDWTHANSLHYAPARDSYWLTLGGVDLVVEVDATSGEQLTVVGGDGLALWPEIEDYGDSYGPHDASWTVDDTLLIFDNHFLDPSSTSRLLEYELDPEATLARQVWSYEGDEKWLAMILGGADRFDDGSTFAHWGTSGYLAILDESGSSSWTAQVGATIADAVVLRDLYGSR